MFDSYSYTRRQKLEVAIHSLWWKVKAEDIQSYTAQSMSSFGSRVKHLKLNFNIFTTFS